MGKTRNSGIAHGTSGSPQGTIEQGNLAYKVEEIARKQMIQPLIDAGVRFTEKDVLFVTKDQSGQTIWLEKGNQNAGLIHIMNRHSLDYKNVYGKNEKSIPGFIMEVATNGKLVHVNNVIKNGKPGFEKIYEYNNNYYTVMGVGTNGFIITMYPKKRGK